MSELDVTESHLLQRKYATGYSFLTMFIKELDSFVYRHLQDVVDVFALKLDFEHVFLEAFAMTGFTLYRQIGHELHGHFDDSIAFTLFATSAFGIEREVLRGEAHLTRQLLVGEELANLIVGLDVGNRIASR